MPVAKRKTKTKTAKPAAKPVAKPATPRPVAAAPAPPTASEIRRKRELICELKDNDTPWIRRHAIYNQLDDLAHVPILSPEEIARLDG